MAECYRRWGIIDPLLPYKTTMQGLHHTLTGPAGWILLKKPGRPAVSMVHGSRKHVQPRSQGAPRADSRHEGSISIALGTLSTAIASIAAGTQQLQERL